MYSRLISKAVMAVYNGFRFYKLLDNIKRVISRFLFSAGYLKRHTAVIMTLAIAAKA